MIHTCPWCNGTGKLKVPSFNPYFKEEMECALCKGIGTVDTPNITFNCPYCKQTIIIGLGPVMEGKS